MHRLLVVLLVGILGAGCGGGLSVGWGLAPVASSPGVTWSRGDLGPTLAARIDAIAGELVQSG